MDPKGKMPLTEDEPSSRPPRRFSLLPPKIPYSLSEDTEKKVKIEDYSLTRKANIPSSCSYSALPTAERRVATSRLPNDRKVLWKGMLTNYDVYYGTLRIPVKSAGSLYNRAEKIPPRRNTRMATVEDKDGWPWKMEVERQRNEILLNCDKYLKRNGLEPLDTVIVTSDSRFGHHIDFFRRWVRRGWSSK